MCLIEDLKSLKPLIACATETYNGLSLYTDTIKVRRAREAVLEFLLINHPLDCPICDQGGECDLQDLTLVYGSDKGRFYDYKRSIKDKFCGVIIKTIMNRCIHCTRCVRFTQLFPIQQLSALGRGQKMEIGNYITTVLDNPFTGTLIDLCPVGALTSKIQAFKYRSWELRTIKVFNPFTLNLTSLLVDIRNNEIIRFRPADDYNT
jgi:NADH dehydrogenase/NADH:ubiquinone oxidoreductase subunit G